jgi:hypothetical protein
MSDKDASGLGSEGSKVPGNISWHSDSDSEGSFISPKRPGPGKTSDQQMEKRPKRTLGRRSGGPRTPEGRASASKNSLTHGAYATRLPDTVEFLAYRDQARVELSPSGLLEATLSDALAHDAFKVDRLREIEMSRLIRAANKGLDTREIARRLNFPWAQTHHELLSQPPNDFELQRAVHRAWVRLAKPPSKGDSAHTQTPSSPEDQRVKEVYEQACDLLSRRGILQHMHEDLFVRLDIVMLEARSGDGYLAGRIREQDEGLVLVHYWLYRNARNLSNCTQELQEEMALEVFCDERLLRASSHVSNKLRSDIETLQNIKAIKERRSQAIEARIMPRGRGKA